MKPVVIGLVAATLAGSLALAQSPRTPEGSGNMSDMNTSGKSQDATFLRKLAEGDMAEVDAGKLAAQKGSNQGVKSFGEEMVKDHSKDHSELKSVAAASGLELPTTVSREDAADKAKLESATGSAFDKQYVDAQVRGHEKTVMLLQQEISQGQDPAVKGFANKTLPVVKHHLAMAKELQQGMNGSASTAGR